MTTTEAAAALEVTRAWLWRLIKGGTIKAEKRGRDWWIEDAEVERYKRDRKPAHRPIKNVSTHKPSDMNTERNTNAIDRDDDSGDIPH